MFIKLMIVKIQSFVLLWDGRMEQTESQRQIHWFEPSDVAVGIIGDLSLELLSLVV